MKYVVVLGALSLAACQKSPHDETVASATVTSASVAPSAAASAAPVVHPEEDALATVRALPAGKLTNDQHTAACSAMRTLARCAPERDDCREAYAKAIVDNASENLVGCSGSDLLEVKKEGAAMCDALVKAYIARPSAVGLGTIAMQRQCGPQYGTLMPAVTARLDGYSDKYDDVGPAEVMYLNQMSKDMSAPQKASLSAALGRMSTKAKAKKRDNLAGAADALAKQLK